jgi:hypothetical protein
LGILGYTLRKQMPTLGKESNKKDSAEIRRDGVWRDRYLVLWPAILSAGVKYVGDGWKRAGQDVPPRGGC